MTSQLRPLTLHDLDLICRQRNDMFRTMDMSEDLIARMAPAFRAWLQDRLSDGTYFGFMAELGGQPVGGIGLMEIEFPPHPAHPDTTRRGRILNLFVEPEARGQGIARQLVEASESEFRDARSDLRRSSCNGHVTPALRKGRLAGHGRNGKGSDPGLSAT